MLIPLDQAKIDLETLIERSMAGEEVIITRAGAPVARMVAVGAVGAVDAGAAGPASNGTNGENGHVGGVTGRTPEVPARRLGWAKGIIIHADFDDPLPEFGEYTG